MKAVILAAGLGTRLGTLIPKPLTSITDEKTILDFQVENISKLIGIDNIILVVGYKKELIMSKFPDLLYVYNKGYAQNNTAKSLLCGLRKIEEDAIYINGDVYFDAGILSLLIDSGRSACVVNRAVCRDEEIKYNLRQDGSINELSKQVKNGLGEALGINIICKSDIAAFREELTKVGDNDYFEKALENLTVSNRIYLRPVDVGRLYCKEIDFETDLIEVQNYIGCA
jgi:choline kinase